MDVVNKGTRKVNPRQNANILSKITFWYTLPLFLKGLRTDLKEKHLYEVLPNYKAEYLGKRAEKEWNKVYSIYKVLWNLFGKFYLLLGLTKILLIVLRVLRPIFIGKFISYFASGQTELTKTDAYFYSVTLILLNLIEGIYKENYHVVAESMAIKFRTAISSLIYRKALKLSVKQSANVPFGKIVSFITKDVNAFDFFFYAFHESWSGIIIVVLTCYNLYQKVGLAVVVLIATFAILILCLVLLGIKVDKFKTATSEKTDDRIQTCRESLCQIRSIKMYAWEKVAETKISEARTKEMSILFRMYVTMFCILGSGMLMFHVTFYFLILVCIWMGQTLTAQTMYFIISAFHSINFYVTTGIPYAIFTMSQMTAALKRLQVIVESLDVQKEEVEDVEHESDEPKIVAKNLALVIDHKTVLNDVNFDLCKGLTLLTGHASSGKSSLLMTIVHELKVKDDSLVTEGRISYAAQEPWLFPSTVKQNILFGSEYDQKRYQKVVKLCALDYDFQMLEDSDDTIVADQGINLSKGQQSRICLARAIYKESDIYLLDDCLSNLDPLVASLIFNNCILKHLRDKLVILVTSNVNLLPYAKNVLKLSNGEVEFVTNEFPKEEEYLDQFETENDCVTIDTKLTRDQKPNDNIYGENSKSGLVSPNAYKKYIELGGRKLVLLVLCLFTIGQFTLGYKNKLVRDWSNLEEQISKNTNTSHAQDLKEERYTILYIYTAVTAVLVSVVILRGYYLYFFTKKASVNMHKKMLVSVLNASLQFFDRTFIGNIVNRFSKDLVTIDENLPFTLLHLIFVTFETAGNLILISSVNLKFLIPTTVLLASLTFLRHFYLKTGRALKRLEATTKAPVVGYLNATLKGLPTIKTFRAENILKSEFDKHQDLYSSATHSSKFCMYAFGWACDTIASFFTAFVILKFLLFSEGATVGDVGLAVSQASMMCTIIFYAVARWAELETQMTSAERIFEYMEIQQETKVGRILEDWPMSGRITFDKVCLSLGHSKSYVLKSLSFVINSGEKIAIVGRTGAGKSSIISSIFRLYEYEGDIIVDGINVKTLSLDFFRSNISVIPQDPLLLEGTVRYNIDPENKYTDEEIWKIIENAKLTQFIADLDTEIADVGATFAQKQLICLARILIKRNPILLLDEISENGDSEPENLIYDIVDKYFASRTVIKITHKMKYAMECDKVLVMDKGKVVEYDSPNNLLRDENGLFYKMVKRSDLKINFKTL